MFTIKFTKSIPTIQDIKALYHSKSYQKLLNKYLISSPYAPDEQEEDYMVLLRELNRIKRKYILLGIVPDKILIEFESQKEVLLSYALLYTKFFMEYGDPSEKSSMALKKSMKKNGISHTFLMERFCEVYLLYIGDRERILRYLRSTGVIYAKNI